MVRVVLESLEVPEVPEWIQEEQGRAGKGRKRNFCLEIHQQGFMSVTERNKVYALPKDCREVAELKVPRK